MRFSLFALLDHLKSRIIHDVEPSTGKPSLQGFPKPEPQPDNGIYQQMFRDPPPTDYGNRSH